METPLLWENKEKDETVPSFDADYNGLSEAEAQELLKQQPQEERKTMLGRILRCFFQVMPLFLVLVAVICFVIQDWITALVVVALTVLHVGLTVHEDMQVEASADILRDFLTSVATVKRDGEWRGLSSRFVVAGDLLRLKMGDVVPADVVLLPGGESLEVDQSVVTGESVPVTKDSGDTLFSGSLIQAGSMNGVAIRTGQRSMVGRSAQLMSGPKSRTRLQSMLLTIAGVVTAIALILAGVLIGVKLGMGHSSPIFVIQTALGMLVAAVPISMAVIVTSAFVLTSRELSDLGIMVTRFAAIEQLSGMEVSLLDKTGTITQNKLQMAEPKLWTGCTEAELLEAASLASCVDAPDAIDRAIFESTDMKRTLDKFAIVKHESFTSVKKHSSATIRDLKSGNQFQVKKGAAQAIIDYCGLDTRLAEEINSAVNELAARGLRSLAVASQKSDGDWRFLGLITLRDTLRTDAREFLAGLKQLGVQPKMITGDGIEIARETCKMVGLNGKVVSRQELLGKVACSDYDFSSVDAFSQVFPEDKFNVVALLQRKNQIVGMTGDGINDCPALRQADIGIAVHGAAPACLAAADMILRHPQLNVIKDAILLCRMSVERLRNYLFFRINCTTVILFWSFFGALQMKFGFPALAYVCIAWTNNLAIFSIICDNALISLVPAKWRSIDVVPLAILVCLASCLELFLVYYLSTGGHFLFSPGMSVEQIRGVVLLNIILLQQWSVLMIRSRSMFLSAESCRPGWLLLLFLCLNSLAGTLLVAFWPFGSGIEAVSWNNILQVWIISGIALLGKDLIKLLYSYVIDVNDGKLVPPDPPGHFSAVALRNNEVSDPLSRISPVTMLDRLFDVLFVVTISHLGTPMFGLSLEWMWLEFLLHWIPVYFTWVLLEGFVNRSSRLFWIPFLYFSIAVAFGGLSINFLSCRLITVPLLPRVSMNACFSFASFLVLARFLLGIVWIVSALTNSRGRGFLAWKTVCAFLPSVVYWCGPVFARYTAVMLPLMWSFGIGLDVTLNFVSSSFFWLDKEWPRLSRYTEERHGMLIAIALAEVVISVVLPRSASSVFMTDRYSDVVLVLILIFVLSLWSFVVLETGIAVENGGLHALQGEWWRKSIWMSCQFFGLFGIVLCGLVAKSFSLDTSNGYLNRVTFGLALGLAIFCGAIAQAMLVSSPKESRRLLSKPVRLLIRCVASFFCVGVAFVSLSTMSDTNWLIMLVVVLSVACVVEWIGRIRRRNKEF